MNKEHHITISDRILSATVLRFFPQRVTPNHLTIFRFFTVPFVIFLIFIERYASGIVLFAISAFTDALDGAMARTRDKITEWGTIYDPMADKLLIGLTAIVLMPRFLNPIIAFFVILIEMLLIGGAYYLKNRGFEHRIHANAWGKAKMIAQSFGIGFLLLYPILSIPIFLTLAMYLLYISIVLGIISLITHGI